jgi:hypothetical protein
VTIRRRAALILLSLGTPNDAFPVNRRSEEGIPTLRRGGKPIKSLPGTAVNASPNAAVPPAASASRGGVDQPTRTRVTEEAPAPLPMRRRSRSATNQRSLTTGEPPAKLAHSFRVADQSAVPVEAPV